MDIDDVLSAHGIGGALGNATASEVLTGATFSTLKGVNLVGTMVNNGAQIFTPGASDITGWSGYFSGITVKGVTVPAANVLTGTTIAGTAGTMPNNGAVTITPSNAAQAIPLGYHNGSGTVPAVTFDASKLLLGTTIAGTAGTMPNQGSPTLQPGASITPGYYSGGNVAYPAPASGSQTFTSSGNWTAPAGVTRVHAQLWGGGGGGGSSYWNGASPSGGGGGGGGGGYAEGMLDVTPGTNYSITIAYGGGGGPASPGAGAGSPGSAGGSSSFNGMSASGGSFGYSGASNAGGNGGAGGTGGGSFMTSISGGKGDTGASSTGSASNGAYGGGGAGSGGPGGAQGITYFGGPGGGPGSAGGGGQGGTYATGANGANGVSPGGGGGGGSNNASQAYSGGPGGTGKAILTW